MNECFTCYEALIKIFTVFFLRNEKKFVWSAFYNTIINANRKFNTKAVTNKK